MSWDCLERKKGGVAHISEARKQDDETEGAEDRRSLMIEKVLFKQDLETKNPVQRNNLFRISYKTRDIGSTDNLVSWLQKGYHVKVPQQCLVNFKIGGYMDEILCDVIPMDVFHVWLGRPW